MSRITSTLRHELENLCYGEEYSTPKELIEIGRKKLFNFDYELFDPNYKAVFETHFIRNFFMREIGHETGTLFQFQLETWLMINLPYYNDLYKSTLLEYNPLINQDVKTTDNKVNDMTRLDKRASTGNTKGNASSDTNVNQTSNTTSNNKQVGSNESTSDTTTNANRDTFERDLESTTPDNRLAITTEDGSGVIEYASKINEDKETAKETSTGTTNDKTDSTTTLDGTSDSTQNGTSEATSATNVDTTQNDQLDSEIKNIEDYVSQTIGKTGGMTYSEMVIKFRESFIRLERDMFREMNELFLGVY